MKFSSKIILLLILTASIACTTGRQISKISDQANAAYANEDYQTAFEFYETIIQDLRAEGEFVGGQNYNRAGLSAWAIGDTTKAVEYLDAARHTDAANPHTFSALAKAYKGIDNLSKEITSLEQYLEKYPEAEESNEFRQRLFITYVESMNWQLALDLYNDLDNEAQKTEQIMEGYFLVHKNLDSEVKATELAKELLKKNEDNVHALQWLAEKHYWLAENRYQKETKAYENNRTNRQYAQLLEAFEILNTDFRIALNYFLRLYPIDPSPAIARYIANIYIRFDDKDKAEHYLRLAGQK